MYSEKIDQLRQTIKSFSNFDKENKISRIHKDNMFNKGHSLIIGTFSEIETLYNRLGSNIQKSIAQQRIIQNMPAWKNNKGGAYPEEVQIELRKSDILSKEIRVDFKAIYLFSVILLDQYVKFLHFINPVDGIKSGTVEKFLNTLDSDKFYKKLKIELASNTEDILSKLNFYRSKKITHRQILNEDTWFMNDMRGSIQISHVDRNSGKSTNTITPIELLEILINFFEMTSKYFFKNKYKIK